MDDEARGTGGLDPARDRRPRRRSPWGRRPPYGHPRQDGDGRPQAGPTYAALDLGTNNCRLLVARPTGDSFRVIDAFSRIIRLGEGVSASGRISEAAIVRAVEALGICRDKMKNRGVTRARLIATEACRAAENGGDFRARIAEEVGLELEIIDRETEARARRHRLHAADRSGRRGRHPVRHRRRLVRTGAARPLGAGAARARRCRRSTPGRRCRSAW